jgi:hypothetical protein
LRKWSHGGGKAGATLGGGARRGGGGALLRPEVGDEAGSWAAWTKRAGRPSGLGGGVGLDWAAGQGRKVAGPVEEVRGGTRRSSQ